MTMQREHESTNAPCTILRIKRKRNEEPLDALVVESRVRRKKYRGGMDVFQFAQTVEDDAWKDENMKKVIQDEISRLTREASNGNDLTSDKPKSPVSRQRREENKRRYTILERDADSNHAQARPKRPPTVISSKDVVKSNFKMYDAIPSPVKARPSVDSEIEKFLPMLNDYLSLHDIPLSTPGQPKKEDGTITSLTSAPKTATVDRDDYVWDIFYHRPGATGEWSNKINVATLTGLPSYESGLYDSDSDSEQEDEEDVDSNAEEYYKNDYPEEDLSDEFHERSEFEESFLRDEDDHEEDLF